MAKTIRTVLKLNAISPAAACALGDGFALVDDAKSPDAIIVRSFDMHGYDLSAATLAVARAGAGTNNIPVDEYAEKGVVVFNTPGANANAVKELCLCALLLASRGIVDGIDFVKKLPIDNVAERAEKGKKQFAGHEIMGKTLGVIGLGAIGVQVGNNAVRLGMNVLGYDPYISVDSAWKLNHNISKIDALDEIWEKSDYITLHVPLVDSTRNMINSAAIAKMKDGVNIVNLSRGELCVNADIISAVKSGKVHSFVTDFAAPELIGVPGIIVMPHLGASTDEAEDNCAVMAARELADFLDNGNIANSVNFPSCAAPRSGACRVTVIHRNVKNVLKSVTDIISSAGFNIENFVSQARGNHAYTIIDTDAPTPDAVLDDITRCENVIRVRKIV